MNKTKIEWCDYTVNPIKGLCPNNCWYCYSKKMYKRFKWNPEVRLDLDCLDKIKSIKEPSKIFVGSMHDIFGKWILKSWIKAIIKRIKKYKKHTFIFLTKFPGRYVDFEFPKNCWLGVTITGAESNAEILDKYNGIEVLFLFNKNIRFISYEPLLKMPDYFSSNIDWVIIGGLTGHKYNRPDEVIKEIITWYTCEDIPIFIKPNLKWEDKIQKYPKERRKSE